MDSPEAWWQAAYRKGDAARLLVHDRNMGTEVLDFCGFACEFALKAVIMKRERFNRWPDRASRPDLYKHDLWSLMKTAGIERSAVPAHLRGSVKVAFSWDVEHRYASQRVPRRTARERIECVLGPDGVLEWLKSL